MEKKIHANKCLDIISSVLLIQSIYTMVTSNYCQNLTQISKKKRQQQKQNLWIFKKKTKKNKCEVQNM